MIRTEKHNSPRPATIPSRHLGLGDFDHDTLDDAAVDYSAIDGSDVVFGAGDVDG